MKSSRANSSIVLVVFLQWLLLLLSCSSPTVSASTLPQIGGAVQVLPKPTPQPEKKRTPLKKIHRHPVAVNAAHYVVFSESLVSASFLTNMSPAKIIGGTNIGIFLLWQLLAYNPVSVTAKSAMVLHFCFWKTQPKLRALFPLSWILSAFSHRSLLHLVCNMSLFTSVAPQLVAMIGNRRFVYLYVASMYFSELFDIYFYSKIFPIRKPKGTETGAPNDEKRSDVVGMGASAAIMYVLVHAMLLDPDIKILNPFRANFHGGLQAALTVMAADALWSVIFKNSKIGHGSHIGGALFGILSFYWLVPIVIDPVANTMAAGHIPSIMTAVPRDIVALVRLVPLVVGVCFSVFGAIAKVNTILMWAAQKQKATTDEWGLKIHSFTTKHGD